MVYVNKDGYLERRTNSYKSSVAKASVRDWWFVKSANSHNSSGRIEFGFLLPPKKYIGKRVKMKITFEEVKE